MDGTVAPDGADGIDGVDGTTAARAVVASRQTATRSVSTTVRIFFLDMLSSSINKFWLQILALDDTIAAFLS